MTLSPDLNETTRMVHGGACEDGLVRTPGPPIQRGSTILLKHSRHIYDKSLVTYGRGGLATQATLRSALEDLEHADQVQLYPSGLAAITGTIQALTRSGDEVLVSDSVYNPTRRFLEGTMRRFGVTARYFRPGADASAVAALITPATRLIYLESPGSLTLDVQDVPAIAAMARARGVLTAIDNTYAAGVLFKPLDHGVDVSIQSLTKYVCGHSDVFMGMAAARGEAAAKLAESSHEMGWAVSPDDSYMALRGLRTLHMRLAQHGAATLRIATWLNEQPEIGRVLCPALPSDPNHALWSRDFIGLCGLISIVLDGASDAAVGEMLDSLKLFGLGYSWGGFESLVIPCDPQLATRRFPVVKSGPMLRLHVGLEDPDDLIRDLRQALDRLEPRATLREPALAIAGAP